MPDDRFKCGTELHDGDVVHATWWIGEFVVGREDMAVKVWTCCDEHVLEALRAMVPMRVNPDGPATRLAVRRIP